MVIIAAPSSPGWTWTRAGDRTYSKAEGAAGGEGSDITSKAAAYRIRTREVTATGKDAFQTGSKREPTDYGECLTDPLLGLCLLPDY
jgi:hypothetical protein